MRQLLVLAAFLAWALAPGIASAAVPDPARCTVPAFIELVGSDGGTPDPAGQIMITVRDNVNSPVPGAMVMLSFGNCSDTRLSLSQAAGVSLDCNTKSLFTTTDVAGRAFFTPMGAANVASPAIPPAIAGGAGAGCCRVYADGIQIATSTVVAADLNGAVVEDGVNGLDYEVLFIEIAAFGAGAPYRGRGDFNHDGVISGADLSVFLARYLDPGGSDDLQAVPYGLGFCP